MCAMCECEEQEICLHDILAATMQKEEPEGFISWWCETFGHDTREKHKTNEVYDNIELDYSTSHPYYKWMMAVGFQAKAGIDSLPL